MLDSAPNSKDLFIMGSGLSGSGAATVYFSSGAETHSILKVKPLADGSVVYGNPSEDDDFVKVGDWDTLSVPVTISPTEIGTTKMGEIYYDTTTQEAVIRLAGIGNASTLEYLTVSGLKLEPADANTTMDVDLQFIDGNGYKNLIGISGITITVMTLVAQPAEVVGTVSPATVPSIDAGTATPQQTGTVGLLFPAEPSDNSTCTIVFTLDNGARFHSDAPFPVSNGFVTDGLVSAQLDGDFTVDAGGALVWEIAAPQDEIDPGSTFQFNAGSAMIDTSAMTSDGDINCTVSGTGFFASLDQTVAVASATLVSSQTWYQDSDSDGYGDPNTSMDAPDQPGGFTLSDFKVQ